MELTSSPPQPSQPPQPPRAPQPHPHTQVDFYGKGGRWEDPQSLLFLTARFLEHKRTRNYSPQTVYRFQRHIGYFRKYCEALGITQARQVTRAVVLSYQSYLFHYRKFDGTPLSVGTQCQWLVAMGLFFSYLTRESLILYNPASDLDLPRKEKRLPKALLSPDDVETILHTPDTREAMGIRDRAIIEVLYSTGIRRMELCNLDMHHVDLSQGLVHVMLGKGKKDRVVPIGKRAIEWVEKYLSEVRPMLSPSMNQPSLFLTSWATRFTDSHLTKVVREIIVASGVNKPGSCHLFRHAFATGLLTNGCDVRHIQIMLGHASLETTQIYTHLAMREVQEAHKRFHPTSCEKPAAATPTDAQLGEVLEPSDE
jgi:integrase/recombinase XerD